MRKQSLLATPLGTESILGELSEDMTKPKPIENWEERLDNALLQVFYQDESITGAELKLAKRIVDATKPFIRKTLKQEIARVGEEIIGELWFAKGEHLEENHSCYDCTVNSELNDFRTQQRKHLQEILKKL